MLIFINTSTYEMTCKALKLILYALFLAPNANIHSLLSTVNDAGSIFTSFSFFVLHVQRLAFGYSYRSAIMLQTPTFDQKESVRL